VSRILNPKTRRRWVWLALLQTPWTHITCGEIASCHLTQSSQPQYKITNTDQQKEIKCSISDKYI